MFAGRINELSYLNEKYNSNNFEVVTVYGKKRVGKTTLLQEFCSDTECIYYVCTEQNLKPQLECFKKEVAKYFKDKSLLNSNLNFEDLFVYIINHIGNKRVVLIMDEFQNLAASDKTILNTLNKLIKNDLKKSKLFLILSSSTVSFIENDFNSICETTGQVKLNPLTFNECIEYLEDYTNEDKIKMYSITGGTTYYMDIMNPSRSIEKNITNNLLNSYSELFEEPRFILLHELRELSQYNGIIEAVASGCIKLNDISIKTGFSTDKAATYIRKLIEIGIIEKEFLVTENSDSKKTFYKICDNFFRFWYKFIFNNITVLELGEWQFVLNRIVKPQLNDYISSAFEDVCKEYLLLNKENSNFPFKSVAVGKLWGCNIKKENEVSLISLDENNSKAFFIECKWEKEPININILDELRQKASTYKQFDNKYYGIFSKSGFTKELNNYAAEHLYIYLYDLEDLCNNSRRLNRRLLPYISSFTNTSLKLTPLSENALFGSPSIVILTESTSVSSKSVATIDCTILVSSSLPNDTLLINSAVKSISTTPLFNSALFTLVPSGIIFTNLSLLGPVINNSNRATYGFSKRSLASINLASGIKCPASLFLKYKVTSVCLNCSSEISSCGVYSCIPSPLFFSKIIVPNTTTAIIQTIINILNTFLFINTFPFSY